MIFCSKSGPHPIEKMTLSGLFVPGARAWLLVCMLAILAACGGGDGEPSAPPSDDGAVGGPPPSEPDVTPPDEEPDGEPDGSDPGDGEDPPPEPVAPTSTLDGVVLDGPVAEASVVIRDAQGTLLTTTSTDGQGLFSIEVPDDAPRPLRIAATGGINVTTDALVDFELRGLAFEEGPSRVSVNVLSTFAVMAADCAVSQGGSMGLEGSEALGDMLDSADAILASLGLDFLAPGMDMPIFGFPESADAAANMLLASEAVAEAVRRTQQAFAQAGRALDSPDILSALACALGVDAGPGASDGDRDIANVFLAALAGTLLETAAGRLEITTRGVDAIGLLEQAMTTTFSFPGGQAVQDMAVSSALLDVLIRNLDALLEVSPSLAVFSAIGDFLDMAAGASRAEVADTLSGHQGLFGDFPRLALAIADDSQLGVAFADRAMATDVGGPPPSLTLGASPQDLANRGLSTTLAFSSDHATGCELTSDGFSEWAGLAGPSGEVSVGPIDANESFQIACIGPGGRVEQSITITVPPIIEIAFVPTERDANDPIQLNDNVRLDVSVLDGSVDECSLERSDTGAALEPGAILVASPGLGVLASCANGGGVHVQNFAIPVRAARLTWVPPTARANGDPLDDLSGYRVYVGVEPNAANAQVFEVDDPNTHELELDFSTSGMRYFRVTAVTAENLESEFSEEVNKDIP